MISPTDEYSSQPTVVIVNKVYSVICGAVGSSDRTASSGSIIDWRTENNVEGSGRGLIEVLFQHLPGGFGKRHDKAEFRTIHLTCLAHYRPMPNGGKISYPMSIRKTIGGIWAQLDYRWDSRLHFMPSVLPGLKFIKTQFLKGCVIQNTLHHQLYNTEHFASPVV
jgi:hypothetical protein